MLLVFKLDKLVKWLSLKPANPTKLSKFMAAMQKKYDKLTADYNTLKADCDELLASKDQDKIKNKKLT